MKTRLKFINASNDVNHPEIVIFQKNYSSETGQTAVAWKVIKNCGYYCFHPFTWSMQTYLTISDTFGNQTEKTPADPGSLYKVFRESSGRTVIQSAKAQNPTEIQVENQLDSGAIGCNIYRDDRLLAVKTSISPEQTALFEFRTSIFVAAVSGLEEGQVMDWARMTELTHEFDLLGAYSADIIMTGGGPGPYSTPLKFDLWNIKDLPG